MDSTQQTPDYDDVALAITADLYNIGRDCFDLQGRIEIELHSAYEAGRRAQLAADVAEIRRIVATTNPDPLAAAALTAMADRLDMLNGGR